MNKAMLIGNVGAEPEVRYYDQDQCVATLRLATTEKGYTLQNGTRVPDRTDWHNLVFYRRLAKVVEQYVHKGDKLYVDGRIQYRQYDDKRGIQRLATEIIVDNMEMLTPRTANKQNNMGQQLTGQQSPTLQQNTQSTTQHSPTPQQNVQEHTNEESVSNEDNTILPF